MLKRDIKSLLAVEDTGWLVLVLIFGFKKIVVFLGQI